MPRSVDGQSIRRLDARLHPATEAHGGCVAKSETRTTAETRSSGPGTSPSMRYRRHDCEGKVFQPCDGGRLLLAMYFATVVCPTSMPSLSSSPCIRGAPQSGFATLISRNVGCTRIVNVQHQHHRRRLRAVVDQLIAYPDLHHGPPLDLGGSVATNRGAPLHAILVAP